MNNKEIFIPFVDVYSDALRYIIIGVAFILLIDLNFKFQPENMVFGHFILFSAILVILISGKIPFQHSFLYINRDGITAKTAPVSIQQIEWSKISSVQFDKVNFIFNKIDNKKIIIPLNRVVMLNKEFAKRRNNSNYKIIYINRDRDLTSASPLRKSGQPRQTEAAIC